MEGACILLASEDAEASELMTRLLGHAGFDVVRATGVDEAIGQVLDTDPPVALTLIDFRSGGTSLGLKLTDMLRDSNSESAADMRVILTTDLDENRLFSWQSGVDGFMVRPYRAESLVDEIIAALGRSTEERAAHRKEQMQQGAAQPRSQAADA